MVGETKPKDLKLRPEEVAEWPEIIRRNRTINLTAKEIDNILSALYQHNSAIHQLTSAQYKLIANKPDEARELIDAASKSADNSLDVINNVFRGIVARGGVDK